MKKAITEILYRLNQNNEQNQKQVEIVTTENLNSSNQPKCLYKMLRNLLK